MTTIFLILVCLIVAVFLRRRLGDADLAFLLDVVALVLFIVLLWQVFKLAGVL